MLNLEICEIVVLNKKSKIRATMCAQVKKHFFSKCRVRIDFAHLFLQEFLHHCEQEAFLHYF